MEYDKQRDLSKPPVVYGSTLKTKLTQAFVVFFLGIHQSYIMRYHYSFFFFFFFFFFARSALVPASGAFTLDNMERFFSLRDGGFTGLFSACLVFFRNQLMITFTGCKSRGMGYLMGSSGFRGCARGGPA
jgi:hypothetical protein